MCIWSRGVCRGARGVFTLETIAAQHAEEMGYEGAITGNAANKELVEHYQEVFFGRL